jgi:hypothetical protein
VSILTPRPLEPSLLEPYARIVRIKTPKGDPEELWKAAVDGARTHLSADIETRSVEAPAADPVVTALEIHHQSPQLTLSLDAAWILSILVGDVEPQHATAADLAAFKIPAGTPVLLFATVWHGPVAPLAPTRIEIAFNEGVLEATEIVQLAEPIPTHADHNKQRGNSA